MVVSRALLSGGTFSTPSPGDRTQGPESTLADQRETNACAWSSSGGERWLPAPWTHQLNRASPPSLRSWQALLPFLQWLSRTHGGVAHGWECAQSTLGAGEAVTAPSELRATPGQVPASTGPLSVRAPGSILPLTPGSESAGRSPGGGRGGSASLPPPSSGRGGPGTGARSHPRTPGAQSHAHPATEPRSPASTHAPPAPVTRVAARTAPDSPARSWGRVSGWQVSPSETGFLGAPRCPTFLPRFGLPLPLPPLSVLLAAASAPPPGLRHSARGPRRWEALEAREAGTASALRWRAAPPLPAAPVPERGAFLIGRSHPPGEGSSQP